MNKQNKTEFNYSRQNLFYKAVLCLVIMFAVVVSASTDYIGQYIPVFNLQQINIFGVVFTTVVIGLSAYVITLRCRISSLNSALVVDKHTSLHDALTGAANRRHFEERFNDLLQDKNPGHALLMIDLDRFKPINDLYGHAAGDALLREITVGFKRLVKHNDLVARLGGDEFAILIKDSRREEVGKTALELLQYVNKYKLNWEGERFGVGASIGLVFIDRPGLTATTTMAGSDEALYTAKETGRGTIFIADYCENTNGYSKFTQVSNDDSSPTESARSHEPEDGQKLMLFAQKMVNHDLTSGDERRRLRGARRRNEIANWLYIEPVTQGDNITPGMQMRELISDAAARSDGGADFSRWVMAMCISAASRLSPGVIGRTDFVIPLPAKSLVVVPGLVDELMRCNALARQPLRHITFILHDVCNVYDSPVLKKVLERLNASEVNVGFELRAESVESLAPLRHIAFSEIHLGLELIKKLRRAPADSATLDALISIGDSFGATLVAPGVKTQEEVDVINEKGIKRYVGPILGSKHKLHSVLDELPHQVNLQAV